MLEPFINKVHCVDCLEGLKLLPDNSIQCVVTSPPYWGLRDYGVTGQLGLEKSPEEYVAKMVEIFREVRRVLKADGTVWLNLGDTYSNGTNDPLSNRRDKAAVNVTQRRPLTGSKPKNLIGIPWRVAFALQADGWYLRQDIIWHKPNPMPESVTDRCTKAHEYIFLLTKFAKYFYNAAAIKEDASESTHSRISQNLADQIGSFRANGGNKTNGPMKAVIAGSTRKLAEAGSGITANRSFESALSLKVEKINKRSVWTIPTHSFSEAHFATFPEKLIEPCILAGSRVGDIVLDPFMGSGTVGVVAKRYCRNYIGLELNPEYCKMAERRIKSEHEQLNFD
jgi:DNA modification methylase